MVFLMMRAHCSIKARGRTIRVRVLGLQMIVPRIWIVFPRPISSAINPPRILGWVGVGLIPVDSLLKHQLTPSTWCGSNDRFADSMYSLNASGAWGSLVWVDGISLPMILLTGLLFVICVLSSWTIEKSIKAYFALFLMLQLSVLGVFLSTDFFLFYVFWEVMLIPMFFLIGVWGGENREYAAIKFFLFTFAGSVLMLVGMIALYYVSGQTTDSFNILALQGGHFRNMTVTLFGFGIPFNLLFFVMMFIGFAIKVPIFPFHTWLPHAHVQAPTAVSVILAGVLLKMGTYGFLRIAFPIFPEATIYFRDIIAWLGLINVIYGALCAMAQTDVKKLIAYSSVSHMGFVMLGLAALTVQGTNGAVLQMFNHGTSTAMMFLMIGVLYERSHHRWIVRPDGTKGFGGLYTQLPIYSIIFIISMFASMGLPGLSGFISEALIFLGI